MATKRKPDAVIGRPKKTIAPLSERRSRGRPIKPFLEDPDRYLCALMQGGMLGNRASQTRVALVIAGIESGFETPPDLIPHPASRNAANEFVDNCPPGMEPVVLEHTEAFDSRARRLQKKYVEARKHKRSREWLAHMTVAFVALERGNLRRAIELATAAGEADFAMRHFPNCMALPVATLVPSQFALQKK